MKTISSTGKSTKDNLGFYTMIAIFVVASFVFADRPQIAMWIGFGLAGYSAIANDSIQTLGTFLSSNSKTRWWILWAFLGSILAAVIVYGWYTGSGDISYERLTKIAQPTEFNILHLLAPIALILLTRLRMPVSTTFLLLSVFSNKSTISGMLSKTFIGYFVAFVSALAIWAILAEMKRRNLFFKKKYNVKAWRIFQWFTTGYLWVSWLTQDIANTAVFLPRALSFNQMLYVTGFLVLAMGFLLYIKGGRIQKIITEKTDVTDVRAATAIDIIFGTILFVFKEISNLPMSTTWVFLGLLAGREVAMARLSGDEKPYTKTLGLVMKDVALASIGLVVSLLLAVMARGDFSLTDLSSMFASVLG